MKNETFEEGQLLGCSPQQRGLQRQAAALLMPERPKIEDELGDGQIHCLTLSNLLGCIPRFAPHQEVSTGL
jgi:hypothetical protein